MGRIVDRTIVSIEDDLGNVEYYLLGDTPLPKVLVVEQDSGLLHIYRPFFVNGWGETVYYREERT